MRDVLRYGPYYVGVLAIGIVLAALAGMHPSVIVLGVIIVLSFTIVFMVLRVGARDDEPLGEPSKSLAFWGNLADKVEARENAALQTVGATTAAGGAASDEDEKERKRQEALARKAARQAKPTGGDA
jgi:hypothetical protein